MKKSNFLLILISLALTLNATAQGKIQPKQTPDGSIYFQPFDQQEVDNQNISNRNFKSGETVDQDFGDAPQWDWLQKFDGSGLDIANDAVVDGDGNMYVTGSFSGTMELSGTTLTCVGKRDIFLAKFDASANLIWLKHANSGEFSSCDSYDIYQDNDMFFITGYFDGPSFTIDELSVDLTGYSDAFLLKVSADGQVEMLTNYSNYIACRGLAIAVDSDQNIYLTGTADGNLGWYHSSFLTKLDETGNIIWWQEHNIAFSDLAISGDQLYIAGTAYMESWLDDILLDPFGYCDAFVTKASLAGQYEWAVMGGHQQVFWGDSYVPNIETGTNGDIFMAGYFRNSVEFGQVLLSSSSTDAFIVRISPDAEVLWANSSIDTYNRLNGFALLENDQACISGEMGATAMFDDIVLETPDGGAGNYAAIYNSSGIAQDAFIVTHPTSSVVRFSENSILQTGTTGLDAFISEYDYSGNSSLNINSTGNSGTAELTGLEVDEAGSIFSLSNIYGFVDFFDLNFNTNKSTLLLARQKPDGTPIWTETIKGGVSWWNFTETTIKLDKPNERIYFHGTFNDSLVIGNLEFFNEEGGCFVACYTTNGVFEWAKELQPQVNIQSVDSDLQGNAYFSCNFDGTVEIEGLTFTARDVGDALILKYSMAGNLLWGKQIETDVFFYSTGIAVNPEGSFFTTLEPAGDTIFFNNGNNTMTFTPNDGRTVVAKYDESGNYLWAKSFGYSPTNYGGHYCWPTASVTDDEGNLYLTGTHGDSAMFDNIMLQTPYNRYSPYTAKIDTDGNALWANSIQVHRWGSNYCEADIDNEGNFYCMGDIRDTIHFGDWQYIPVGYGDIYLARYNNNGELNWVKTIESTSSANHLYGMAVYDTNNLFVGGRFANQIFAGEKELYTASSMAGFLVHIGDSIAYTSIDEKGLAEIYVTAYPNPASDLLYLDFNNTCQSASVEFANLNGQRVKSVILENISGTQQLNLGELPKGMYLLTISTKGITATRKILIQ